LEVVWTVDETDTDGALILDNTQCSVVTHVTSTRAFFFYTQSIHNSSTLHFAL